MSYECIYCGNAISPSDILFFRETTQLYQDLVRYEFLESHGMFADTSMDDAANDEAALAKQKFGRLYYFANPGNIDRVDSNGFPTLIHARPCDGLTSDELLHGIGEETVAPEEYQPAEMSGFGSLSSGTQQGPTFQPSAKEAIVKPTATALERLPSRACPHCHCELPEEFGTIPVHSVQLLGGRASGKTAFLTCLHQQLNKQLVANNLGNAHLEKESMAYLSPKIAYYEQVGTPRATSLAVKIFPLVYHVVTGRGNQRNEAFVSIHDIAGEGMQEHSQYLYNLEGVTSSRTFLYLIDPNQLNQGGYYDAIKMREQGMLADESQGYQECYKGELFSTVSDIGRSISRIVGDRSFDDVVVVMSKIDMPLTVEQGLFGSGSLEIMHDIGKAHNGMINGTVLRNVHNNILSFINAKAGGGTGRLIDEIANAFRCSKEHIFLSCISTHTRIDSTAENGHNHFDFKNLYNSEGPKHRIIEPFLILLWRFGMLPAMFDGKLNYQTTGSEPKADEKKKRGLFGRRKK